MEKRISCPTIQNAVRVKKQNKTELKKKENEIVKQNEWTQRGTRKVRKPTHIFIELFLAK